MDLRQPVVGILCGGSPAPGINAVISAATIEATNNNCLVLGIYGGWSKLKYGYTADCLQIQVADVIGIHSKGGSFIKTSKEQLTSPLEVDNALRALQHHRVQYLITIGGTETAFSSYSIAMAAKKINYNLSVVHVPKTIFSDLPLPLDARTFGFSTARDTGTKIVCDLLEDARSLSRWYLVSVIGSKAGHLALGIGKSAAATMTLIPEEFEYPIRFAHIVDHVEACMLKRDVMKKEYGIVLLTEGLVDKMDPCEIKELFGDVDRGHDVLNRLVADELDKRIQARDSPTRRIIPRWLGFELRAGDPNATDRELARDLGYGAIRHIINGGNAQLVTMQHWGDNMTAIPLDKLLDRKTGTTQVRLVDTSSLAFEVAQKYMLRLRQTDLDDPDFLYRLSKSAKLSPTLFVDRYKHVVSTLSLKILCD